MLFDVRVISFDPQVAKDPVEALMRAFKVERAVAQELVRRLPRVIKRAAPLDTAQRFCDVLDALGARTEIVMTSASSPDDEEPPARTRVEVVRQKRSQPGGHGQRVAAFALGAVPANANVEPTRRSALAHFSEAALLRGGAGHALSLPDPAALGLVHAPRGHFEPMPPQGLPEPREPDPLEADIDTLVERALAEQPGPAPRRKPDSPDPEESRITRSALPNLSDARPTAVPETRLGPAPFDPVRRLQRSFRPARPAPELAADPARGQAPAREPAREPVREPAREPAREPVREAVLPTRRAPEPAAPAPLAPSPLFALAMPGPPVDLAKAALPGARALERNLALASWLMGAALALITFGALPLLLLGLWLRDARLRWARVRAMRGSALPVSHVQLPELDAWLKQFATRLGLADKPRLYLGRSDGRALSAVCLRGELHVLLDADALSRHLSEGPHVVSFLLAHELARFALGQHARPRAFLAALWPMLTRMDALCADALALQLLADRSQAQRALLVLLAGPFASQLEVAELERQLGSHERAGLAYTPALDGGRGHLLSRLHHMQTGYLYTAARASARD